VVLDPRSNSEKNAFKVLCSGVHILAGERAFLFSKNVHTGSEAHPSPLLNWWLRESGLGAEVSVRRAIQVGREITVHPDNTHLRLDKSLYSTAQHTVRCKMVVWQQCAR